MENVNLGSVGGKKENTRGPELNGPNLAPAKWQPKPPCCLSLRTIPVLPAPHSRTSPVFQLLIMPLFLHLGLVSVDSVRTLAERSAAAHSFCWVLEKVAFL